MNRAHHPRNSARILLKGIPFAWVLGLLPASAIAQEENRPLGAEESSRADIAIIAETQGWPVGATYLYVNAQSTFRTVATQIAERFPEDFSSAVNLASPGDTPEIYFRDEVPPSARAIAEASGLEIELIGGIGKNAQEWAAQTDRITDWVVASGCESYGITFDSVRTIEVVIGFGEALQLPEHLAENVVIYTVKGEVNRLEANVHGGTLASNPGGATFGWCVETSGGTRGLVTAAHVSTKGTYTHPVSGNTESVTRQDEYYGQHGEFEWYTTTGSEWPNWFADQANNLRRMDNVKSTWFRNDDTCVFGRSSNQRACDQIYRTSYTGNIDGNTVERMVLTDTDNTIGGDSGGGWSYSTTAHGVHSGDTNLNGAWRNRYSRAARVDNAMNVDICESP